MDTFDATAFHATFDNISRNIMEGVRDELIGNIESHGDVTPAKVIAQIIMNFLDDGKLPTDVFSGQFGADHKAALVHVADYMGPDWAQALYHAAVFITKVA